MPGNDWAQLEQISHRIDDLHQRRLFAERIGNSERAQRLAQDIIAAQSERNALVERIKARLGAT